MKWRRLGDTVLWTAALEALLEEKSTEITVALPAEYDAILRDDPRITRRILLRRDFFDVIRQLRSEKFDVALNFHAGSETRRILKFVRAKEKLIHHHARAGKPNFSSPKIPNVGVPVSAIERDLNVVRALGWKGPSPSPRIFLSEERKNLGRKILEENGLSARALIILAPGASRPSKQWPFDRWALLAERLSPSANIVVVTENLSSLRQYGPLLERIKKCGRLIETRALEDLMGVLSQAQLFIGSDSGAKHLSAALGVRTITLFGPESVGEWHGYDPSLHRPLQSKVLCRTNDPLPEEFAWCGVEICPYSSHACLSQITVDQVQKEATNLLACQSPSKLDR
jgi:ADP-heptose:LPS heptosyltransferase